MKRKKRISRDELVDKIVENAGQEKFDETILRIYSAGVISELNFNKKTMDNLILPLSQLGIIKAGYKYFPPGGRPSNGRTHCYLFSISSRKIVDSVLERLNVKKIFDIFISKYPVRLSSFMVFFLIEDNV